MQTGPEFIGIGAQKAGTTWLSRHLSDHPKIRMHPAKEAHYFDNFDRDVPPSQLARYVETVRPQRWKRPPEGLSSDEWYRASFGEGGECRGEITPRYAILSRSAVAHMRRVTPDVRILFVLRNPIERAWSALRMRYRNKGDIDLSDPGHCRKFIDGSRQRLRSDYERTLENYTAVFQSKQILLCFFDAIIEQPEALLIQIHDFLGVPPHTPPLETLSRPLRPSPKAARPAGTTAYLKQLYGPMIERLARRFGGYCARWRASVNDGYPDDERSVVTGFHPATLRLAQGPGSGSGR